MFESIWSFCFIRLVEFVGSDIFGHTAPTIGFLSVDSFLNIYPSKTKAIGVSPLSETPHEYCLGQHSFRVDSRFPCQRRQCGLDISQQVWILERGLLSLLSLYSKIVLFFFFWVGSLSTERYFGKMDDICAAHKAWGVIAGRLALPIDFLNSRQKIQWLTGFFFDLQLQLSTYLETLGP